MSKDKVEIGQVYIDDDSNREYTVVSITEGEVRVVSDDEPNRPYPFGNIDSGGYPTDPYDNTDTDPWRGFSLKKVIKPKIELKDGYSCIKCKDYHQYAEANMPNDAFCCYRCRTPMGKRRF